MGDCYLFYFQVNYYVWTWCVYIVHTYKGGTHLKVPPGYLIKLIGYIIMTTQTISNNELNETLVGFTMTSEEGKKTFTIGNTAITFAWTGEQSMLVIARHGEVKFNSGLVGDLASKHFKNTKERIMAVLVYIKDIIMGFFGGMKDGVVNAHTTNRAAAKAVDAVESNVEAVA